MKGQLEDDIASYRVTLLHAAGVRVNPCTGNNGDLMVVDDARDERELHEGDLMVIGRVCRDSLKAPK